MPVRIIRCKYMIICTQPCELHRKTLKSPYNRLFLCVDENIEFLYNRVIEVLLYCKKFHGTAILSNPFFSDWRKWTEPQGTEKRNHADRLGRPHFKANMF